MIARIAVAAAVYAIDKPYSYRVPEGMDVRPGMRVRLPFGAGNRRTEGVVLALEQGDETGLKAIDVPLDESPVLSEGMLHLAGFLRERYFCTLYDAVRAILPAGLWFSESGTVHLSDPLPEDWEAQTRRKPEAQGLIRALLDLGGAAREQQLREMLPDAPLPECIRYLTGKKLIAVDYSLKRRVNDRMDLFVRLEVTAAEAADHCARRGKSAPLQKAVLELLSAMGSACAKDVCYFTGASMATLRRLEKLGLVSFFTCEVMRRPKLVPAADGVPTELSAEQRAAYEGLCAQMDRTAPGVALLHGVTGSGKTAVYLELIARCLAQGRQAIFLVPEIALTPQLLGTVAARFGRGVAVLHSSLPIAERYDEWKRVRSGEARLVVGTRSAVFAPVPELGLIIVDEEHEHTYKSENTPYYHAREVAIYRGNAGGALVVLGSATPSIESMYRAKTGVFSLYTLSRRYSGAALPEVLVADMKKEIRDGNGGAVSRPLLERMLDAHSRGKKTILFLNRRGTNRMAVCVECGHVPQCPRCSVHLTYHAANERRMCHYCGYSEPASGRCPACGGRMKYIGYGTQWVAEELARKAPELGCMRMDADSVSAANPHEKILSDFETGEASVLIGTQMVTKGLNFEAVTLVGVLDADSALYVDHFRASETAFSMMTQVIGRSGRFRDPGTAVIQTMTPENPVIQLAARQDYDAFYESELALRRLRQCPPFRDLITITVAGQEEARVLESIHTLRAAFEDALRTEACRGLDVRLLGPAGAPVPRVNNTWRYRLTLCAKNSRPLRALVAHYLRQFSKDKRNKGVFAFADVNAYD